MSFTCSGLHELFRRCQQDDADPPSLKFTWTIPNFSSLSRTEYRSNVVTLGGYKWQLAMYAKGDSRTNDHLSMFLRGVDFERLPNGWKTFPECNVSSRSNSNRKNIQKTNSWGYSTFMPLKDLNDATKGYLVNDSLVVEAELVILRKTCAVCEPVHVIGNISVTSLMIGI
ncbi:ubiquitin C-terminal hydrolase 13-like [Rutidosis leptorrhynchoides]|uniref:ubiquitin C-terminal hydrolase 13-like n=1 Tax=Rutidosis leptorrhynchoides TaxID=125765 RepID=UPI003A9A18D6